MRYFALIFLLSALLVGQAIPTVSVVASANRDAQDRAALSKQLRRYDLLELDGSDVAEQVRQTGRLSLTTSDGTFDLSLSSHDVRAANYRSEEPLPDGTVRSLERTPASTYKGTVRGMNGAQARFTLDGNTVEGVIVTQTQKYFVEPVSRYSVSAGPQDYVIYRESDVFEEQLGACPTLSAEVARAGELVTSNAKMSVSADASSVREAELATEADNEFVAALGSAQAANNEILSIINMVDGVYQNELGLTFRVVYQRAWSPATPDPYSDTTDAVGLINELRGVWNSNPPAGAPARDLVHLWTGKSTNAAGIAFGSVVCRDNQFSGGSAAYGLSKRFTTAAIKVVIPAHELGHNLGATHPDQESPAHSECNTTIMNSNGTFSTTTFCQFSRDQITNFVNTYGGCLGVATAPPPSVQLSSTNYSATEGTDKNAEITVTRSSGSGSATVSFETMNQSASERNDFTTARGTITFAAGETSKKFNVFITDDVYAEGAQTFGVLLSNPSGATLGTPSSATVTIVDNDATTGANPVKDESFNPAFFVRQHYIDFLNREPDAPGLSYWVGQFTECDSRPVDQQRACRDMRKVNISAAFFLSIEFQETGFFVIRLQRAAFGRKSDTASARVSYQQFLRDSAQVCEGVIVGVPGFSELIERNKQTYAQQVVASSEFASRFPGSLSGPQFVDALFASAGLNPTATEWQDAVNAYNVGGRVAALRAVAESHSVHQSELNASFVLMQYYGYMRRNPTDLPDTDDGGYQFWLGKLNLFGGNFVDAQMVQAFLASGEYQNRFGP